MTGRGRRGGPGRSIRSYVVELALAVVVIVAIYLWMTNGGPAAFGTWFAGYFAHQ